MKRVTNLRDRASCFCVHGRSNRTVPTRSPDTATSTAEKKGPMTMPSRPATRSRSPRTRSANRTRFRRSRNGSVEPRPPRRKRRPRPKPPRKAGAGLQKGRARKAEDDVKKNGIRRPTLIRNRSVSPYVSGGHTISSRPLLRMTAAQSIAPSWRVDCFALRKIFHSIQGESSHAGRPLCLRSLDRMQSPLPLVRLRIHLQPAARRCRSIR